MGRPPLPVGTAGAFTLRRVGDGWKARAYVRDADGRRREVARFGPSKARAEAALKVAIRDRTHTADDGAATGDTRLSALAARWLEQVEASDRSAGTVDLYRFALTRHVEPALGGLRLREVTVPRIDAALQAIRENSGPATAKSARSVLSGVLGEAVRLGAIPSNPVRDAARISRRQAKQARALDDGEIARILAGLRSSTRAAELDLPDLVSWMLGTGMRIGEVCAVRADVLDLEAGTVEVNATVVRLRGRGLVLQERPKSAAGWRVLALPPHLVDMLRRRAARPRVAGPDEVTVLSDAGRVSSRRVDLAFPSPRGMMRDPDNTAGDLRLVLDAIEGDDEPGPFGWVTSHVFRKTVATRLDDAGLSARQIADVLGHAQPSMTQDVYMGRKVVSADAARVLAEPAGAA